MQLKFFILTLFLLLLLPACGPAQPALAPAPALALEECTLTAPGSSQSITAQCGTLSVPENRAKPEGRVIDLNIAVIKAVTRSPAPDPLFFLAGGPGQAATESAILLSASFDRVHQKRDIVLVDQRGTGKSNPLKCFMPEELEAGEDDTLRAAQSCLDSLDADLTQYTTSIAMLDLDEVRQALGYEQINLYGLSYGTRAAQTYMKMFPERVRSAVLDGVVPQEEPLGLYVAQDAQRALDLIFARCQADLNCNRVFPEVDQDFNLLLDRLKANEVEVSLLDPLSGEPLTVTFGHSNLAIAVRLLSYSSETAALLPLLIYRAENDHDLSRLAAQYLILARQLSDSISLGMNYSVLCAEDQPFIAPEEAARQNRGTYLGDLQTAELAKICSIWPAGRAPSDFHAPLVSEKPVLLLSGEADPVTPAANAEDVARLLPNSLSVVVKGQGHNVAFRGCIPWVMADFIENASVRGLDLSCLEEIGPMPFFLNFAGPVAGEKP